LAKPSNGRHRANVELNVLEEFELRSRRSMREAERARKSRSARKVAKKLAKIQAREAAASYQPVRSANKSRFIIRHTADYKPTVLRRRGFRDLISMTVATGIFATVALPAYALSPDVVAVGGFTLLSNEQIQSDFKTQTLSISAISVVKYNRGKVTVAPTSSLNQANILNAVRTYTGPTAADYILNPPYSKLDGTKVMQVAASFVGTPYVFGGETPSGFDCSGYVRYVFAHFGIDLPHTVIGQSHLGILIKPEDAMPGDIVILNDLSHDGIYAGNGMFYHAPRPGDDVKLAPIFTPNVFFVRLKTN
jgi:cell wall-associated NlpC family hydrolase